MTSQNISLSSPDTLYNRTTAVRTSNPIAEISLYYKCFRTGTKISEQTLITRPVMLYRPTDLDGLRRLRALKTSESKIDAKDKFGR
jgi:hypothetical protein